MACAKQAKAIEFASIMTIGNEAAPKGKKCRCKRKNKKRAGVAAASIEVGVQPYMSVKPPSFRVAHLKAMAVSLEAANTILPSPLYADPMLPLLATLAIFKATLDSLSVVLKDKAQVAEADNYLARELVTVAMLVDKSTPTVVALFDAIPHCEGGRQRGPGKTLLFNITCGLA